MPRYEDENTTRDKLYELRKRNKCQVCGGMLNVFMDFDTGLAFLACNDWHRTHHEGIVRGASRYEREGLASLNIETRREIMEQQFGKENTASLTKYHGVVSLTKPQAMEILKTIWPEAPETEMQRAVILCANYGLNPLMNHVFLIPFKGKEGTTWATIIGIKAKRLLAARKFGFSYIDDTPRVMTEKERDKIFGESDPDKLWVITKLRDEAGNEVVGYGFWPTNTQPYGTDKGNTKFNMAAIRSESQALDRLCPGEMPVGVEAMTEEVAEAMSKEGAIEGEFKEVPPAPAPEEKTASDGTPTLEALKEMMQLCNWSATDVGAVFIKEKGWKISRLEDLTSEQIAEVFDHIKNNPK